MADFEVKFSEINKSFKLIESGSEGDSGTGLTDAAKQAMLQIARKVAYIDEHGQTYYDDLYDALYGITAVRLNRTSLVMAAIGSTSQLIATTVPAGGTVTWASSDTSVATVDDSGLVTSVSLGSCTITATAGKVHATCAVSVVEATLVSIDAVYTQSGTVYDTADLDDLKTDLVVTATWSSGTTSEVSSSDYALSGTLTVGTSTVTVTYGECTDTFTVNVTAAPTLTSISAVYTQSGTVYDTDTLDSLKADLVVTATYSDQTTQTVTDFTLSGTLAEGTSVVTVSYGGKTTTFSVTVTHYDPYWLTLSIADDFVDYGCNDAAGATRDYKSANNSRASHIAFDIMISSDYRYTFEYAGTAKLGIPYYSEGVLEAVANHANVSSYKTDAGWKTSGYSFVPKSGSVCMRLTFDQNKTTLAANGTTELRITREAVS